MLAKLRKHIKNVTAFLSSAHQKQSYTPMYRVVEINKDEHNEFEITIQVINKNVTFQTKPEKLLADDNLVDLFSPRDIRTLTYLGYLGINSPKYKILAQKLSQHSDKMFFAIKKKGEKKLLVKSADQIMKEKEMIKDMHPEDANRVGYVVASESVQIEKAAMQKAKEKHKID